MFLLFVTLKFKHNRQQWVETRNFTDTVVAISKKTDATPTNLHITLVSTPKFI